MKKNYGPNQTINGLTFLREVSPYVSPKGDKLRKASFKCYCGKEFETLIMNVIHNKIISCGCYRRERMRDVMPEISRVDGRTKLPYYKVWCSMISRCSNTKNRGYKNYGGRGISVCEEWQNPFTFNRWLLANDYGKGLQIDRIDNDGNYEPSNCRIVHASKNSQNRRNTILDFPTVKKIREFKLAHPQKNNGDIGELFGLSRQVIRSVTENKSWQTV